MKEHSFTYYEPESRTECMSTDCDECFIVIKRQNLDGCFCRDKLAAYLNTFIIGGLNNV